MENKDIIREIEKRYIEAQKNKDPSFYYDITKEKGTVFIKINSEEYSITRQALADKPDGIGSKLADKIWNWIHR